MQERVSTTSDERVTIEIADGVAEVMLNRPDKLNAVDPGNVRGDHRRRRKLEPSRGFARRRARRRRQGLLRRPRQGKLRGHGRWGRRAKVRRYHSAHPRDRQCLPAGGLYLAHASRSCHRRDPRGRVRRRLPDRPWRRHALCRAGRAPRDHGDKMGPHPRYDGNCAHARARPLRRHPRTRDDRTHLLRDGCARSWFRSLQADPLAAARSTAKEIAARNPTAVRAIKRLLNATRDADAATILLAESKEQAALVGSPNQIEAVRAGMEGRPGRFVD
jgi:hypothetical protein